MELSYFLKENKKEKANTTYPATKSLCDENGKPLEWVIKPLSTRENEELRDECLTQRRIGKEITVQLDPRKYIAKLICACVVEPDLHNKKLLQSYNVNKPEDLIMEMIDDPGEYNEFGTFVQNYNGFDETIDDAVEEAKN